MVTGVEAGAVRLANTGCGRVLWAAGVAASPLGKKLGAPMDRAGRVVVQSDLSIPGHPEVFVIGDLASLGMSTANAPRRRARCHAGRPRHRRISIGTLVENRAAPSITSIKAASPLSAARQRWRSLASSTSPVSSHGSRGCSCTFSSLSGSATGSSSSSSGHGRILPMSVECGSSPVIPICPGGQSTLLGHRNPPKRTSPQESTLFSPS